MQIVAHRTQNPNAQSLKSRIAVINSGPAHRTLQNVFHGVLCTGSADGPIPKLQIKNRFKFFWQIADTFCARPNGGIANYKTSKILNIISFINQI